MEYDVDRPADVDVVGHVAAQQAEAWRVGEVLDVDRRTGDEVVEAEHLIPVAEQVLAQVRTEEAGAAGHNCALDHLLAPS